MLEIFNCAIHGITKLPTFNLHDTTDTPLSVVPAQTFPCAMSHLPLGKKMSADKGKNVVVWFEIPAAKFLRAVVFYEKLFGVSLQQEKMGINEIAVFPYDQANAISGCVMSGPGYAPGKDGAVVYLNADAGVDAVLANVEGAGGEVLLGKTALPPGMGFFAHILDSEGNRVGVHSLK